MHDWGNMINYDQLLGIHEVFSSSNINYGTCYLCFGLLITFAALGIYDWKYFIVSRLVAIHALYALDDTYIWT